MNVVSSTAHLVEKGGPQGEDEPPGCGFLNGGSNSDATWTTNGINLNGAANSVYQNDDGAVGRETRPGSGRHREGAAKFNNNDKLAEAGFADPAGDVTAAPRDTFFAVYWIMVMMGIGVLLPWNMYITASKYYTEFKLQEPLAANATNGTAARTDYQRNFNEYLGLAGYLPNIIFNFANIFMRKRGSTRQSSRRLVSSAAVRVLVLLSTFALSFVDSSTWIPQYFALTMVSIAIVNACTGIYQNILFGLAACLPMEYTNAVVTGTNVSGLFTAVVQLVTMATSPSVTASAQWYFGASTLALACCLALFFALPRLNFYHYYKNKSRDKVKKEIITNIINVVMTKVEKTNQIPYGKIFKKIWIQCYNVWGVFFVTFTCFPGIQVKIKQTSPDFFISEKYFTAVTCFLLYNFFVLFGNIISHWVRVPGHTRLFVPVTLRAVFVPMLVFCNYSPAERTMPVYIHSDYLYTLVATCMAFSSGYFASLAMMYAPRQVESKYAGVAAQFANFFLVFGIFTGISFSRLISWAVQY